MSMYTERAKVQGTTRRGVTAFAFLLGWSGWHGSAGAANVSAGVEPTKTEERICPAAEGATGLVVCFADGGAAIEEQAAVRAEVQGELEALAREGHELAGSEQLLVRVEGVEPNYVFGVQPIGGDGVALAGGGKTLARCGDQLGCTSAEWHGVVRGGMLDALGELREDRRKATMEAVDRPRVGPETTTEPQRYRPRGLGIAGIVTASVGGLGVLTGAGLMIVGAVPDTAGPGFRQDRTLLIMSRDFYTPGAVTLGASAAVVAGGIAMVIVDLRRWKAREGTASTAKRRMRVELTASTWGRGVRIGGRF